MNGDEEEARARAGLTAVARPGDLWLAEALSEHGAAQVWSALVRGEPPPGGKGQTPPRWMAWARGAAGVDIDGLLADSAQAGVRFVAPGDPEWPGRLDTLPTGRDCYGLWVRGHGDLRHLCLRSVAIVGARAASPYGEHVARELAYGLAERSFSVVSGGAYGIDGAAHRSALLTGRTVAVLAGGLDVDYPRGHAGLFAQVARNGALVSERPIGRSPRAPDFLIRNRLIAALTPGTVVVEAGRRSGALNTATHANELHRILMAVPGPVTSATSVGCHRLLREGRACCVTGVEDVIEQVVPLGQSTEFTGPVAVHADLAPETARILAVVDEPGVGTAEVAQRSGEGLERVMRSLGMLAAAGLVERCVDGWRLPSRRGRKRA
ncbi:DNA-processing protein DprA [Nocardiopsis alkaliphila]|uniref:DNA-processing protein DprA n=1 Tax=Nocardiopsis alkaliphila TaxID=225762 RepID=UPI000348B697|nr:DNA-processing protein DprA [Nocardiopsis alkaliphila]